jgi:hypothetical protein
MATVQISGPKFTIDAASAYQLGGAGEAVTGTVVIQCTVSAFVGTGLIVKARKKGSATAALVPIPYVRRSLAGAASDDTVVSAALTGSFLIKVDASGLDIFLDATGGYTSGSVVVEWEPVRGSAA